MNEAMRRRRTEQFADYLRLMHQRRMHIVRDKCFIIFAESRERNRPFNKVGPEHGIYRIEADDPIFAGRAPDDEAILKKAAYEGWAGKDLPLRYIQYAFLSDRFFVEMPNNTLCPSEAQKVLTDLPGFFFVRERPDEGYIDGEEAATWNPVQRIYRYGEEGLAARHMASILYDIWRLLPEAPLLITAAAFEKGLRFENDTPLV